MYYKLKNDSIFIGSSPFCVAKGAVGMSTYEIVTIVLMTLDIFINVLSLYRDYDD